MKLPRIIKGNSFTDIRGTIFFNNSFDASDIKSAIEELKLVSDKFENLLKKS